MNIPSLTHSSGIADRACGALIGLAVGDALGAPVEFRPRGSFSAVSEMRAGGRFRLPAGAWTDDTAMALCLADSLLAAPHLDEADLLDRFCRWAETGENSSTGVAVGIGQITLRNLGHYRRTGHLAAPQPHGRADGNGALMRIAPVAIMHHTSADNASDTAIRQGKTTHHSAPSDAACGFTAHLIAQMIQGVSWTSAISSSLAKVSDEYLRLRIDRRHDEAEPPSTGFVLDTIEAALWAIERTDSFEAALIHAVNLGVDADTVGAVTGQIAGARYGLSSIPARWLELLVQRERIEAVARSLLAKSTSEQDINN
ncbi:ADP-ribosylglycohydrolase family protein [Paracoccus siganidrum]|nr:ADP-ribosylglycohydrolase family protein [Paracoccus siganidrum]